MTKPRDHAGLIAFAFVLVAFGIVAGVFLAAVPLTEPDNRTPKTGQTGQEPDKGGAVRPPADRPISEGRQSNPADYVAGHRWWRKKLTRTDLDRIVRKCIETPSHQAVFVTRDGATETVEALAADQIIVPDWVWVRLDRSKRPEPADVLQALRVALDKVEYRDGPGR